MDASTPRILVGALDKECTGQVIGYAEKVSQLLGSKVNCWRTAVNGQDLDGLLTYAQTNCDLLFLSEPVERNFLLRMLKRPAHREVLEHIPASLWLVRQPHWPIHTILLIVRGEIGEEDAEEWALHLAQASGASVAVQIISPAAPALYNVGTQIQAPLNMLLTIDAPVGVQLRRILFTLKNAGVEASLQQHSGKPNEQIAQEIAASAPDLIVIAAEKKSKLWRWWMGELVEPLLQWIDRPVLIVRKPVADLPGVEEKSA